MPFPRASQALSRFTVLDLTRVRSGPTCVRQLADWGANVIKIETPPHLEKGEGAGRPAPRAGLPEPAPQQAQHHARSEIAAGPRGLQAHGRESRRGGREFPPRREGPARHRLRVAEARSTSASSRQHLRLRPGRALSRPPGLRPDRAGHGRADVDHRPAGAGPGARRHPDRRSLRRPVLRARHPDRRCSSAKSPAKASGSTPRCCRRRSSCSISRPRAGCRCTRSPKQAGNNHPTSIPTGVFKTKDGHINIAIDRPGDVGAAVQRASAPGADQASRLHDRRAALEKPRRAQRRDRQARPSHKTSAEWIDIFNKAGVPCGPIYAIDQMFADEQVKHLGIAQSAKRPDGKRAGFRRPAGLAVAHAEQDRGDAAGARPAHRRGAQGIRLRRQGNRRAAQRARRCDAVERLA